MTEKTDRTLISFRCPNEDKKEDLRWMIKGIAAREKLSTYEAVLKIVRRYKSD